MRFLIQATIPTDVGNKLAQESDKLLENAENYINSLNPESVYFTEINGEKAIIMVVNRESAGMIDVVVDSLSLKFSAKVQIRPALTFDDLKKANQIRKDLKGHGDI